MTDSPASSSTLYERLIRWMKNQPIVAILLVLFAVTVALGTLTDSIGKVERWIEAHQKPAAPPEHKSELQQQPQPELEAAEPTLPTLAGASTKADSANERPVDVAKGAPEGATKSKPPLLTITGTIAFEAGAAAPSDLHVGLIWTTDKGAGDIAMRGAVGSVERQPDGEHTFRIEVYSEPSSLQCFEIGDELLGVAAIFAFDDRNHDGVLDHGEVIGAAPDHCVTFTTPGYLAALEKVYREDKKGKKLEERTLLKLSPGLSLTRAVRPAERGLSTGFDDLVPLPTRPIGIHVPAPGKGVRIPNWT